MGYRVVVHVKEVRGKCAMGYQPGDTIVVERFYIKEAGRGVCLQHHGDARVPSAPPQRCTSHSPRKREKEGTGYARRPNPRKARGRTVAFEPKGEELKPQPESYNRDPHPCPTAA